MTRIKDQTVYTKTHSALTEFEQEYGEIPGVVDRKAREIFVLQIIDSVRRQDYAKIAVRTSSSAELSRPKSEAFNPIRGAAALSRKGNVNEACWLIFLATQFGYRPQTGWAFVEDVYGGFTNQVMWDWTTVAASPNSMTDWISTNIEALRMYKFGSHRQYATLKDKGTGQAIRTYIAWISEAGGHEQLFHLALRSVGQNPEDVFDYLYQDMSRVHSFGRLGKFDYLTMLGKLGLAPVRPGKAYFQEATGPKYGAQAFFGSELRNDQFEFLGRNLADMIGCDMQVIEDALCNWQKNKNEYVHFKG